MKIITAPLFMLFSSSEISNYEDIGLKSFLIFCILSLGTALYKMWQQTNKLQVEKTEIQDKFREEVMTLQQNILSILPNYERAIIDATKESVSKDSERLISVFEKKHDALRQHIDQVVQNCKRG